MKKINLQGVGIDAYISEKDLLGKIATYLFINTSTNTNYGTWCTDSEEMEDVFPRDFVESHVEEIVETLLNNFREVVSDVETYKEDDRIVFDVNLYGIGVGGYLEDDVCLSDKEEEEEE